MIDRTPEPASEPPTVLLLRIATTQGDTLGGTVRRLHDDEDLPFHGVVDLVGTIERLVGRDGRS